jgi:hypothetical protein
MRTRDGELQHAGPTAARRVYALTMARRLAGRISPVTGIDAQFATSVRHNLDHVAHVSQFGRLPRLSGRTR